MGKRSVRSMTLAGLIGALGMISSMTATITAQSGDPATLPLLTPAALNYLGGFRLPAETVNGDSFSIGGRAMTFHPAGNSLFIGSRDGRVAEVSIPIAVNSTNVNDLPFASFRQPFADPTDGHLSQVSPDGVAISGLMVDGDRLYGTASIYYDANNTQRLTHYSRSLQLNQASFSGWSQVGETGQAGFVAGALALVPAEWQSLLGGNAITGQCCIPIAWRTSWGPAAFAFDLHQIGQPAVAASPRLFYTGEHATLGPWDGANPTYGATIQISGLAIVAGTRTALYIGRNGLGPNCYGNGTSIQSLNGTTGPDGATWCYDPTTGDKGSHAYPYRYQIWAYDLNDFVAVKEGRKQPWEVVPYGVWPFDLPTPEPSVKLGGIGYDALRQILYISQLGADQDGYSYRPIIHAIHLDVPAASAGAVPPVAVAPVPAPSPVNNATIVANKVSPQLPGTTVRFTAAASAGTAPYQFKWWIYEDGWKPLGSWTNSSTMDWTSSSANPGGRVTVWVRSAGNTVDQAETSAAMDLVFGGGTAPVATAPSVRTSAVTIAADKASPQTTGTSVTFSAAPIGGAGHQYKWWIYEDGWKPVGSWTTSSTFTWTPTAANAGGRVTVWVRSGGNTADEAEAAAAMDMVIAGAAVATPPPAPPTTTAPAARIHSMTISASKVAPQPAGSTTVFTALPTGGTAPYQYKWWVYNGDAWIPMSTWTTSNTFAWTSAVGNAGGRVTVWARSAGNPNDEAEATAAMDFVIK